MLETGGFPHSIVCDGQHGWISKETDRSGDVVGQNGYVRQAKRAKIALSINRL